MPIKGDAKKVQKAMKDEYGEEEGERVFYATANKQKRKPETWKKKAALTAVLRQRKQATVLSPLMKGLTPLAVGRAAGYGAYEAGADPVTATMMGIIGGASATPYMVNKYRGGRAGQAMRDAKAHVAGKPTELSAWRDGRFRYRDGGVTLTEHLPTNAAELARLDKVLRPQASKTRTMTGLADVVGAKAGLGSALYLAGTAKNVYDATSGMGGSAEPSTTPYAGKVTSVTPEADGSTTLFLTQSDGAVRAVTVPNGYVTHAKPGMSLEAGQSIGVKPSIGESATSLVRGAQNLPEQAGAAMEGLAGVGKAGKELSAGVSDMANGVSDMAKNVAIYGGGAVLATTLAYLIAKKSRPDREERE